MSYKPLVNVESGESKRIKSWTEDGLPTTPQSRIIYGGAYYGGYIHLKTLTGEVITFPAHEKAK